MVSKGGRGNEGGINKAERDLGLGHNEAHRAIKIASLTPEAKKVATELGLDDNKSVLLAAKDKSGDAAKEVENLRAARAFKDAAKQCASEDGLWWQKRLGRYVPKSETPAPCPVPRLAMLVGHLRDFGTR
jgi:hypothetical protein